MRKGWEIKRLEDVCQKASSNIAVNKIENDNGDYPIYGASGFLKNVSFYHQKKPYIGIIKDGAGVGRISLLDAYSSVIGTLQYLIPNPEIDIKYFHYFLLGINFSKYINGSTIPHIYFKDYKEEPFLYVPISEQQQIVSILDEAFAAIDQAKENLQRNLQNAKELFQSELNNIFEKKGDDWVEKKLNEVCEVKDGTHDSPRYLTEGIPFVTQKNIRESGLSFDNTRFITQSDHDKFFKRSNVSYRDILLSMIGANRGMACIVDDKRIFSIKNVCLIKANEKVNQHYLLYYLKSQKAINFVKSSSKGGAQEFIGLTELRNFPTPLAPLKEQKKIVSQLNTLSAETKNLENTYQKKLDNLEELKKSILQKAFSGELTIKQPAVA